MLARHNSQCALRLFTQNGERKYLSQPERIRFYKNLCLLEPKPRTFCEMIFWTGCRPSEARALIQMSISLESCYVVFCSLKKRDKVNKHFRIVPLPQHYVQRLVHTHQLSTGSERSELPLWTFGRTTAWQYVNEVMCAAGICGVRACARGLRHGFGVHAAMCKVPETRIQKYLGHASLSTTAIYLDMAELEDREMARRMWADISEQ